MSSYTCGVLTVSDKGSRGERDDTSGVLIQQMLAGSGFFVKSYQIVPDQVEKICTVLTEWVDTQNIDLIVTTGGTGVDPRDVTPEATRSVIDREVPGISEIMRQVSFQKTFHAMLSRGIAGIRKQSLIINLPGSKKAAGENLAVVLPALPHAIDKIKGSTTECGG